MLNHFMVEAMKMAKLAYDNDEVPVGAIIVKNEKIIGRGFNQVITKNSVSSHAEINAINQASKFTKNYRLNGCDIYVTLEPCHMCAKAIVDARIDNVIFWCKWSRKQDQLIQLINFFDKKFLKPQS